MIINPELFEVADYEIKQFVEDLKTHIRDSIKSEDKNRWEQLKDGNR